MSPVSLSDSAKSQSPFSYLYTSLASSHLGEALAMVISCLISSGRSTAKEITARTNLTAKEVKTTLVALIQLRCIQYWNDGKAVYYQFNPTGIHIMLHAGDIITHIKGEFGDEAAELVQNVIQNGSFSVGDYLSTAADEEQRFAKAALLTQLHNRGWLVRLQPYNYYPLEDLWNKLYQETLKTIPRTATTSEVKRVLEAKAKTMAKLKDQLCAGTDSKDLFHVEGGIHQFRPNVSLCFSLARYEKHLRTRALADLAGSRFGLLTGKVFESCCKLVEAKSPDLHPPLLSISGLISDPEEKRTYLSGIENALVDSKLIVFNVRDVPALLSDSIDLSNSILTQNFLKPGKRPLAASPDSADPATKKIKLEDSAVAPLLDSVQEPPLELAMDNNEGKSIGLIVEHIRLLCSSSVPFLYEVSPGSYTVPFLLLEKHIKAHQLDALVKTTLGGNALRVLRCIKDLKLADEKAISTAVLLKERDVKNELYRLFHMNLVEIQEVPRSLDRAALKTFYLFRHKDAPSYRFLAHVMAHTMADILAKMASLKLDNKILLEKCEREDVKGHENELLLDTELKTLRSLQNREVAHIGRFNRVKWLYVVFGII